jgi:hypothetical protein
MMNIFKQSKIAVSTYDPLSGNATPGRQVLSYRYKLFTVNVISETPQVELCTHSYLICTDHSEGTNGRLVRRGEASSAFFDDEQRCYWISSEIE